VENGVNSIFLKTLLKKWGQLYFSEKPTTSRPNFPYWKLEQKWGQLYFSEQPTTNNQQLITIRIKFQITNHKLQTNYK
jgi:hypothetical protein